MGGVKLEAGRLWAAPIHGQVDEAHLADAASRAADVNDAVAARLLGKAILVADGRAVAGGNQAAAAAALEAEVHNAGACDANESTNN